MKAGGISQPTGGLGLKVIKKAPETILLPSLRQLIKYSYFPGDVPDEVRAWRKGNFWSLLKGHKKIWAAKRLGVAFMNGALNLTVIRKNGLVIPYGLAGVRLVTDNGVDFIVDGFQNIVELELMKFHGIGTGSTAEAQTETALVTELTTEYVVDNTRATGSTIEGGSTNVYRTVGTNEVDAAASLREHGVLNQAATGGGVLLDRTLFALITLASGDKLESTYDLTLTAGG